MIPHPPFAPPGLLLQCALLLLVIASLARGPKRVRLLAIGATLTGLVAATAGGAPLVFALWLGLLLAANLFQLLLIRRNDAAARFTPEEERMAVGALARLGRAQARHLIDQGLWMQGRAGETLTEEGQPVSHLFYLESGSARVTSGGREIATLPAPGFIGEMTILDSAGATGTVTLAGAARFWCIPAETLRRFLTENPDIGAALEASFVNALREKLEYANRRIAEGA